MGEHISIDQLYHKSWFKGFGISTLLLILYTPIGLALLLIRGFIILQFLLLGWLLPSSKFKQKCLRVISAVLGISVGSEGDENIGAGMVFVANHITIYDHFAIHLKTNAVKATKEKVSKFFGRSFAVVEKAIETLRKDEIEASADQYIVFPETESSNGEVGVLAFKMDLPAELVIQPVAVKVSRPWLNTSCIGGSVMQEILVLLFCPNTHFTLRFLPPQTVDAEGNWKQKVQADIAQSLGIVATKLNASDTAEYVKRLYFRPPSLATMAREVQKKLAPQTISPELIISTLQRTGSVEGALQALRQSGGLSSASSTFSKSATQRMMSFQERKRIMIAEARQKYIEKHGLDVPS